MAAPIPSTDSPAASRGDDRHAGADLARLLRTLRHLQGSQLAWRVRYTLQRRFEQLWPSLLERRVSARAGGSLEARDDFPDLYALRSDRATADERSRQLERGELCLLHECRPFRGGSDWRVGVPLHDARLWTFHLHYLEWLYDLVGDPEARERGASAARSWLTDWIASCELGSQGFAQLPWNSYAIATRIEWWVRIQRAIAAYLEPAESRVLLRSLARQAAYLAGHIEWDLRANHLLRDARGLAFAGRFLEGDAARRWLGLATRLAREQAAEQVLADGGHFERSPMYHLHAMEDLWMLTQLLEDEPTRAALRETWLRMADWLRWVRHPDGDIPLLNDAGLGVQAPPAEMLSCGRELGFEVDASLPRGGRLFEASGIMVWHGQRWAIFFDVGPLGPDYQPGHGHADNLTLECSLGGHRFIVDPGTVVYDACERRRYDRSTAAHNTVCIGDRDSSEVWHIFRVGRRAAPRSVRVSLFTGGFQAEASHDGYDHLPGNPRHSRRLELETGGLLRITDRVTGTREHRVTGGWLLAPPWRVTDQPGGWHVEGPGGRAEIRVCGPDTLRLERSARPYHPSFGRELQATWLGWTAAPGAAFEVQTLFVVLG